MTRTTEAEIAAAIVTILRRRRNRSATMADIREAIPTVVHLTKADRAPSPTRPGEALWHQQIRNVRSHQTGSEYGLRSIEGGFALVTKPAAHVVARLAEIRRDAR